MKKYLCLLLVSTLSASFSALAVEDAAEKSRSVREAEETSVSRNAPAPNGDVVQLPAMTVTAQELPGEDYLAPATSTATKTDTPIMEIPVTVNTITQQSLQDRLVSSIEDTFDYTSGFIRMGLGGGPFSVGGFIRGFMNGRRGSAGGFYFRDGMRTFGIPISIAKVKRIEVLKGPASVLYGQVPPGGIRKCGIRKAPAIP